MNDKIKEYHKLIDEEIKRINSCKHKFGEPYYDPEFLMEPYGFKYEGQGSDPILVPEGYKKVEKPRWTRKCVNCGFEEHTNKMQPIIKGYTPDFNK